MSNSNETFELSLEQAELYEAKFVPAIFAQWTSPLLDAAAVEGGQRVLDAACGTGILARIAADRVGPTGTVVGVDRNDAMLAVARRLRSDLEWRQGDVADLPFPDETFDAVLCQSALRNVLSDATQALREMRRVCKPGGVVGVQVFASLEAQPAYGPWVDLVARHAGPAAMSLLGVYWVHGDLRGLAVVAELRRQLVVVNDAVDPAASAMSTSMALPVSRPACSTVSDAFAPAGTPRPAASSRRCPSPLAAPPAPSAGGPPPAALIGRLGLAVAAAPADCAARGQRRSRSDHPADVLG